MLNTNQNTKNLFNEIKQVSIFKKSSEEVSYSFGDLLSLIFANLSVVYEDETDYVEIYYDPDDYDSFITGPYMNLVRCIHCDELLEIINGDKAFSVDDLLLLLEKYLEWS